MGILDEIRQAEQNLAEAQLASDVNSLASLLSDDLLFVSPAGELASKAMDLETHRSGTIRLTSLVPREPVIKLLAHAAIVSVIVDLQGTFAGQRIDGAYRYLRVWTNQQGTWQITAGSVTQVVNA
jgi:ketosteroid isomerase-like protein